MRVHELALSHFTVAPVSELQRREPGADPHWKPNGLWVSVDGTDDWLSHCRRARGRSRPVSYPHRYRVRLRRDCRVALLESLEDMETFSEMYPGWRPYENAGVWSRVSEEWDGIIVAPFQPWANFANERFYWYTAWDCASGCIWDPRAVESFEEIVVH